MPPPTRNRRPSRLRPPEPRRSPAGAPPGLANCAGCHRLNGRSANPHIPRLDLQSEAYLAQALQSLRDRRCESGIIAQVASAVPEEALPVLTAWFASVPPAPGAARVDAALAGQGEALAWAATRDPEIPACTGCKDNIAALAADHAGLEAEAERR